MDNIVEFLISLFEKGSAEKWIIILLVLLILILLYFIREVPKLINKSFEQSKDYKNNRQLQVEAYFRKMSGDYLREILANWFQLLDDADSCYDTKKLEEYLGEICNSKENKDDLERHKSLKIGELKTEWIGSLVKRTILYASDDSIRLMSNLQQYIYTTEETDYHIHLAYVCNIISSLKKDFSGFKVDPMWIMESKINDVVKEKDNWIKIFESVSKKSNYNWKN